MAAEKRPRADRPLRVLQLTVSDTGGAGVACIRLHQALRQLQIDSRVLVRTRSGSHEHVIGQGPRWYASWRTRLDGLPLRLYPRRQVFAWWSVNWLRSGPKLPLDDWEPDLVHAHWTGDGFVPIKWFNQVGKPVVWTMHDMWPFTGGCHYAADCERYRTGCGACPQLGSTHREDLSFRSARRKASAWTHFPGAVVSPGIWLAEMARQSAVFRNTPVQVIPNGLDGKLFAPGNRSEARTRLDIPQEDHVLLAGAVGAVRDERKGFSLLTEAIRISKASGATHKWRLLVFGAAEGPGEDTIGIPVSYRGNITVEQQLPLFYQAADVYTLPSLQDNLPNTAVEALACGTPVVGFRSSGLATMIDEGRTGRLADPFSPHSLAAALRSVVPGAGNNGWAAACRQEFENLYAWPGPAIRYMTLYNDILTRKDLHN